MGHYERIAEMIRHLDQSVTEQPDLHHLAARAGLSSFHFHRLFSAWTGVTPKDFLQCLTLTHIKKQLREGKSVLDAAFDAGLSGPGRAHDLCVRLEAASPGEIKSGGKGIEITAGFSESPFGLSLIAETPRGICHLAFIDPPQKKEAFADLQKDWPGARLRRDDSLAVKRAGNIFNRSPRAGSASPLRAFVKGTEFQVKVWQALLKIPQGAFVTYGRLAEAVGKPSAARAVGSAVGRNPVAYLIPCHRVIRETGVIGEYHWGPVRKKAMIVWENANQTS